MGAPHASALMRGLRAQSRGVSIAQWDDSYPVQQGGAPVCPERSAWIGGHGTEPYEQNTQQSPGFGRNVIPQPVQT